MGLEDAGVKFVAEGYSQFMRDMSNASKAMSSMGRTAEISFGRAAASIAQFTLAGAKLGARVGGVAGPIGAAGGGLVGAVAGFDFGIVKAGFDFVPKFWAMIGKLTSNVVKGFVSFGKSVVTVIGNVIKTIGNVLKSLFNALTGGAFEQGNIGGSLFAAMFKFEVLKQVIRKIIEEIKSLVGAAFTAAQELQTLEIRITGLIGSMARSENATLGYADSIEIAGNYTQELLNWMQELALATPFELKMISHVESLTLAMGWGVEASKNLTEGILNYSAGMGLSNDVMERIIFNFAQMRQAGKVTGTELRDLARGAFMPINEILQIAYASMEGFTGTFQDFRDAASEGAISVETFFDAFLTMVNRDFPDAARNMNYTFSALRDNIKDFFETLIGWNMIRPAMESFTKPFVDLMKSLSENEGFIRGTKLIGEALRYIMDSINSFRQSLLGGVGDVFKAAGFSAPTIENIIKTLVKFGATIQLLGWMIRRWIDEHIVPLAKNIREGFSGLDNLGGDMFTWGFNAITQFAAGIMQGAASVLTAVLNEISAMLAYWFAPGSPPRIAPDIDQWGMETIAEWLHGFTLADFDVLDSMQSAIRGALDSLAALGGISEDAVLPMYRDLTIELIQAMDEFNRTGQMSTAIFDRLRAIGGVFGGEIAELLDLQLQLAVATERAAAAEEAYNRAVEATKVSTANTNKLVREYNAMLRGGAGKQSLTAKLRQVQASQLQLDADRKREIAAKAEMDAAKAALKPLEDAVKLQEKLISQLVELAKLEKEIADQRAGAGGGGAGALEPGTGLGDLGSLLGGLAKGQKSTIASLFAGLKEAAIAELGTMWGELGAILNTSFNENFGVGSPLRMAWINFVETLLGIWNSFTGGSLTTGGGQKTRRGDPNVISSISDMVDAVIAEWNRLIAFLNTPAQVAPKGGSGPLYEFAAGIRHIILVIADVKSHIERFLDWLAAPPAEKVAILFIAWSDLGLTMMVNFITGVSQGFDILYGEGGVLQTSLNWMIDTVLSVLGIGKGGKTGEGSSSVFFSIGRSIIQGIIDGINDLVGELLAAIQGAVTSLPAWVVEFLQSHSPSKLFARIGASTMTGMALGITQSAGVARQAMAAAMGGIVMQPSIAMAGRMSAPSVMGGNTVNFGDVNINNGLDQASFAAMVRRAVFEG